MLKKRFFLILLSAVGAAMAYPPADQGWLIFLMPAVWFFCLLDCKPRAGFGWGWLWGGVFYSTVGYPLTYLIHLRTDNWGLTIFGWLAVAMIHALAPALFGWLATRAPRSPLLAALWIAACWTVLQWLRGLGPFGFLWAHWAVALYRYPLLLQVADLGGTWLVEFLIAFWNASLALLIRQYVESGKWKVESTSILPSFHPSILPLSILALWLGYGFVARLAQSLRESEAPKIKVAIMQPNLDLTTNVSELEWEPVRLGLRERVQQAAMQGAQLAVFPESIEPAPMPERRDVLDFWRAVAKETGCAILLGGYRLADPAEGRSTNTAYLIDPQGEYRTYDKVKLVPLGETVPFRKFLPFLSAFGVVEDDLVPGKSLAPLVGSDGVRIGVPICMEATYPWIARGMTRQGANLLAVVSNESWFGRTAALEQHAAFTVLRAIETRRWIVRSAPQGISGFYRAGGTFDPLLKFTRLFQVTEVPLLEGMTLYVRFGDWIIWACWGLGVGGWVLKSRSKIEKPVGERMNPPNH